MSASTFMVDILKEFIEILRCGSCKMLAAMVNVCFHLQFSIVDILKEFIEILRCALIDIVEILKEFICVHKKALNSFINSSVLSYDHKVLEGVHWCSSRINELFKELIEFCL